MFAPLILPFQITFIVIGVLTLIAAIFWAIKTKRVVLAVPLAFVTPIILFVPTLFVVGFIVDAIRYGKFEFATGSQIGDSYVQVPESAMNVTLHKYASGHEVRMNVDEAALLAWMDAVTKRRGEFAKTTPFVKDELFGHGEYAQYIWETRFAKHGWEAPEGLVKYKGWRSSRGSGFDVYYSPQSQAAFISAAYW